MASLDHSGLKTIMSTVWQPTQIDMSRCFISSGQHLVDGKGRQGPPMLQQDGATPHTSKDSLAWLNKRFSDRLTSRKCDPQWSPYSPDLNPPYFYLWGYLKDRVYVHNPQSISDLKREIKTTILAIPREECKKFIDNFVLRIQVCLQRQGAHFEHFFFWALINLRFFIV